MALHLAERRYMQLLDAAGALLAGVAFDLQQVAVRFAKRVVDLRQHGAQPAAGVMAMPEADGIEYMAGHAREGLQPDLAIGGNIMFQQQRAHPPLQAGAVTRAVVAAADRQRPPAVHAEPARITFVQPGQVQAHIK